MYNPRQYKIDDIAEAFELIEHNPFATVVSSSDDKPIVSLLPLTPIISGTRLEIIGHLAKANSHWMSLLNSNTILLFQGAHSYITPRWYTENDVPTWNYSAVQISGEISLIEDENGIIECLKKLTAHAERIWPSGWEFFIPDDLKGENLTRKIVGFKISATSINFKKKLTQGRSAADRAGVINGLKNRKDELSQKLMSDMLRIYYENGERR